MSADTIHCGSTGGNEVWAGSGNVHIVECDVTVAIGSTLTIEEGAIVKFNQAIKITVAGTLRIVGTEADPVYLTSIHDDTVGGDTNGNGASTEPDLRDWAGIHYLDTSSDANSLIEHGVIRYAGYNFKGSVNLAGASPTIRNSTLEEGWYAILADLLSFPKLESNVYRGQRYQRICLHRWDDQCRYDLGYDGHQLPACPISTRCDRAQADDQARRCTQDLFPRGDRRRRNAAR